MYSIMMLKSCADRFFQFFMNVLFMCMLVAAAGCSKDSVEETRNLSAYSLIEKGEGGKVIKLLKSGHITPHYELIGMSLLEIAALYGELELTRVLVADHWPEARHYLIPSLFMACANERMEIMKLLIEKSIAENPDSRDVASPCAFMAVDRMNVEMAAVLAEFDTDFGMKNSDGLTAMEALQLKLMDIEKIKTLLGD